MKKIYVRIHPMAIKRNEVHHFWDSTTVWNRSRNIVKNQVRHLELTKLVKERIVGGGLIRSSKSEFSRYWNSEEVKGQVRNHHGGRILSVLGNTDSKEFNTTLKSEYDTYINDVNHEIPNQNEEKITLLKLILHLISEQERGGIKIHSLEKSFIKRQVQIFKGHRKISLEQLFNDPEKLKFVIDLLAENEIELVQKESDGSCRRGDKNMVAVFANVLTKKKYLKKRIHGINVNSRIKAEAFGAYFGISISQRQFDPSYLDTLEHTKYEDKFNFIPQYIQSFSNY